MGGSVSTEFGPSPLPTPSNAEQVKAVLGGLKKLVDDLAGKAENNDWNLANTHHKGIPFLIVKTQECLYDLLSERDFQSLERHLHELTEFWVNWRNTSGRLSLHEAYLLCFPEGEQKLKDWHRSLHSHKDVFPMALRHIEDRVGRFPSVGADRKSTRLNSSHRL